MKYRIVEGEFGPYIQYFLGIGRFGKWCDVVLDLDGGFIRWPFKSRNKAEEWLSSNAISGSSGPLYYALFLSFVVLLSLPIILRMYYGPSKDILTIGLSFSIPLSVVSWFVFLWIWNKWASKKEVI